MVLRFFALAYAITWIVVIPVILKMRGLANVPEGLFALCAIISGSGPSIAALILVRRSREGFRSLCAPPGALPVKSKVVWAAFAICIPFFLHLTGATIVRVCGGPADVFTFGFPAKPEHVVGGIVAAVGEELGWRGYALRRMRDGGLLRAALVVGVIWGVWHLPMFYAVGMPLADVIAAQIYFVTGSVIMAAVFRQSQGSVLVMILFHLGSHLENVFRTGGAAMYATVGASVVIAALCVRPLRR